MYPQAATVARDLSLLFSDAHKLPGRLGADLELNLASGLLCLVNIAHCRALRWIACLIYPLALRSGLIAIAVFVHYLTPDRRTLPF